MVVVGGIILALISYRAAVAQAQDYGDRIRSAMDLYRFDLLKSLRQAMPENLGAEIKLWEQLMLWLYNGDRGVVVGMKYDQGGDNEDGGRGDKPS
jgi:hypothetical protein